MICSGIKPIFDMAKSLEVLETNGVNVVTFGQDNFPDYFGKEGAEAANLRLDSHKEIADLINCQFNVLRLDSAILLGVGLSEAQESEGFFMRAAINQATSDAKAQSVAQTDLKPFVNQ